MADSDTDQSAESCEFDYGSAEERIDILLPGLPVESDESDVGEGGSEVDTPFIHLASPLLRYSPYVVGGDAGPSGSDVGELLPLVGPGSIARNSGMSKKRNAQKQIKPEKGCTFNQTTVNMINYMVGLVMMSLPNSFSKLGWVAALACFSGESV